MNKVGYQQPNVKVSKMGNKPVHRYGAIPRDYFKNNLGVFMNMKYEYKEVPKYNENAYNPYKQDKVIKQNNIIEKIEEEVESKEDRFIDEAIKKEGYNESIQPKIKEIIKQLLYKDRNNWT
jgi:hypothetical protein